MTYCVGDAIMVATLRAALRRIDNIQTEPMELGTGQQCWLFASDPREILTDLINEIEGESNV
jgi:hypothetical protein